MAGRQILIDGYNVIGADAVLSGLQRESLEAARDALIKSVAGSPRFLGDAVTIVFDGAQVPGFSSNQRFGHVTATFSNAGASADDVIKARAQAARDPATIVVVTNDGDIRDYCRGLGCAITGSENLLEQLTAPKKLLRARRMAEAPDDGVAEPARLSTVRKGNPKRLPKRQRNQREYRF